MNTPKTQPTTPSLQQEPQTRPGTPIPNSTAVPPARPMSPIEPLPPTYEQLMEANRRSVLYGRGPVGRPGQAQQSDEVMMDRYARGRR